MLLEEIIVINLSTTREVIKKLHHLMMVRTVSKLKSWKTLIIEWLHELNEIFKKKIVALKLLSSTILYNTMDNLSDWIIQKLHPKLNLHQKIAIRNCYIWEASSTNQWDPSKTTIVSNWRIEIIQLFSTIMLVNHQKNFKSSWTFNWNILSYLFDFHINQPSVPYSFS